MECGMRFIWQLAGITLPVFTAQHPISSRSDLLWSMAFPCIWQLVLLFALLRGTMSHGYQMRLKLHRRLSSDTLQLLEEMGAGFPRHCRSQGLKIKTLDLTRIATNSKTEDKIMIIYQILLHISKIYRTNVCSKPWDKNGMEKFETHLHQQLEELSQDLQRWSDSKMPGKKRIHKYFTKLRIFLENKEYSRCAWEMIHYESRKNLQQAINLLA